MNSIEKFWNWLSNDFLNQIIISNDTNQYKSLEDNSSFVIWFPIVRQLRLKQSICIVYLFIFYHIHSFLNLKIKDSCEVNSHLKCHMPSCVGVYSINNQEENSFDLNWNIPNSNNSSSSNIVSNAFIFTQPSNIDSLSYKGQFNTYSGGGYIYEIKENKEDILNSTKYLNSLKWIDLQTSALFVDFTLFNANINLFIYCSILFEINSAGSFVNSAQFKPIDLYFINQSQFVSFKLVLGIVYMILLIFIMVLEAKKILLKEGWKYFLQSYNYIQLTLISFSWATFAMFLYCLFESSKILSQIHNKDLKFINFQYIDYCNDCFYYFLGVCVACASIRLITVFRFIKRVTLFQKAFENSLKELTSMGFLFFIVWISFVQLFFLIMNNETDKFSSLVNSMETCFQIILGRFDITIFLNTKSVLAPFIFIVYIVIIMFVFLNVLVSILIDNLHLVQNDKELEIEDPNIFSYLKSLFSSFSNKLYKKKINVEDMKDNKKETISIRIKKISQRLDKVNYFKKKKRIFFKAF